MKVINGGNFSYTRGVSYPIVVSEDTEYRQANFAQASPHTAGVFAVAPGVLLRLVECNLVNVSVPDGAEIVGGNLIHAIDAPTGDATRTTIKLLHECEKCCTALGRLQEDIAARTLPKDPQGRILHHEMKARYAARRLDSARVTADRTLVADSNLAAMQRFGRTVTTTLRTTLGRGT